MKLSSRFPVASESFRAQPAILHYRPERKPRPSVLQIDRPAHSISRATPSEPDRRRGTNVSTPHEFRVVIFPISHKRNAAANLTIRCRLVWFQIRLLIVDDLLKLVPSVFNMLEGSSLQTGKPGRIRLVLDVATCIVKELQRLMDWSVGISPTLRRRRLIRVGSFLFHSHLQVGNSVRNLVCRYFQVNSKCRPVVHLNVCARCTQVGERIEVRRNLGVRRSCRRENRHRHQSANHRHYTFQNSHFHPTFLDRVLVRVHSIRPAAELTTPFLPRASGKTRPEPSLAPGRPSNT